MVNLTHVDITGFSFLSHIILTT